MSSFDQLTGQETRVEQRPSIPWVGRVALGWERRRTIFKASLMGLLLSTTVAFLILQSRG